MGILKINETFTNFNDFSSKSCKELFTSYLNDLIPFLPVGINASLNIAK